MLSRTVISNQHVACAPVVSINKLGARLMSKYLFEKGAAFVIRHSHNAGCHPLIRVNAFAASDRMSADHRVNRVRRVPQQIRIADKPEPRIAKGSFQSVQSPLHPRRQWVICSCRARKQCAAKRFAVFKRNLQRMQYRATARVPHVCKNRMPFAPGVNQSNRAAILDNVRDNEDFGIALQQAFLSHVNTLELSEPPAKLEKLCRGNALTAEKYHGMLGKCIVYFVERPIIDILCKINSRDLRT